MSLLNREDDPAKDWIRSVYGNIEVSQLRENGRTCWRVQISRRALFLVAALVLSLFGQDSVLAQTDASSWTEPDLLTPDPFQFRVRPFLTADRNGNLHAIWHEGEELGPNNWRIDAIFYSSWDGSSWSEPVDILASPSGTGGKMAAARGLISTPNDRLLIVRSQSGRVIISQAPIQNASSPHAWSSISVDMGVEPILAISPDGEKWCVAFWNNTFTALDLRCSSDRGDTWIAPITVWSARPNAAGNGVEALVASDGRVHLVWTEHTQSRSWNGEAIWHAVIDPESGSLSVREVMRSVNDLNLDNPTLTECPDGQIHIFWNNSIGSTTGRFHQYSEYEDEKWSEVAPVFPGLSGLTSKAGLVCDNTGRVHLITAAAGPNSSSESWSPLRYATWFNGVWSDYDTWWEGRYSGERPSMVIAGGNQLHILWDSFRGIDQIHGRFIAHSHRTIEASPIPALPMVAAPTATAASERQTQPSPIPNDFASIETKPVAKPVDLSDEQPLDSTVLPIAWGGLVGLFFVVGIVGIRTYVKR